MHSSSLNSMILRFLVFHLLFCCCFLPFSLIPFHTLEPKCSPGPCFCSFPFPPSYLPYYLICLSLIPLWYVLSPFLFTVAISLHIYSGCCSHWNRDLDLRFLKLCGTSPHGRIMGTSHLTCLLNKRFVFPRLFILQSCHPRKCNSILLESFLTYFSCNLRLLYQQIFLADICKI